MHVYVRLDHMVEGRNYNWVFYACEEAFYVVVVPVYVLQLMDVVMYEFVKFFERLCGGFSMKRVRVNLSCEIVDEFA